MPTANFQGDDAGNYVPPPTTSNPNKDKIDAIKAQIAKIQSQNWPGDIKKQLIDQLTVELKSSEQKDEVAGLNTKIDKAVTDSTIHPEEISKYRVGDPLNYDEAYGFLDQPTGMDLGKQSHEATAYIDPEGRNAESDSLRYYDDLIKNGGHDAVADAAYEKQRADAEQGARAQRDAAQMDWNERGMGSGGNALLSQLVGANSVGQNAHTAALGAAGMRQDRMDNAAISRGVLGGNLHRTDADIALKKGGAQDSTDQVVAGFLSDLHAQKADLATKKATLGWERGNTVSDADVNLDNEALYHNKDVPWKGVDAFTGTTNTSIGLEGADAARAEREAERIRARQTSVRDVLDYTSKGVSTAAKASKL